MIHHIQNMADFCGLDIIHYRALQELYFFNFNLNVGEICGTKIF
jgi:hypothetical protein